MFDAYIILEKDLFTLSELETLYSFVQHNELSLRDYIENFNSSDDSLDFLKEQKHYKTFGKKNQTKRCEISKKMFLEQYDKKRKGSLAAIVKESKKVKRA